MADIDIPQAEADSLMVMEKRCEEDRLWHFPAPGVRLAIPLKNPLADARVSELALGFPISYRGATVRESNRFEFSTNSCATIS